MLKSVKAIILASVMVSMSVMLINSCGVSNPAGSSGNPSMPSSPLMAMQASGGVAPAMPILDQVQPTNFPQWLAEIDAARPGLVPILFGASISPYLNPNASGTPVPFSSLAGNYKKDYGYMYQVQGPNQTQAFFIWHDLVETTKDCNGVYHLRRNNHQAGILLNLQPSPFPLYKGSTYYAIPCGIFPPDTLFPPDLFAGNGLPDGYYVLGGNIYDMMGGKVANKWPNDRNYKSGYYPKSPQQKLPQRLTIYTASPTIKIGEIASFSATLYYTDGSSSVIPANQVSWTSSAPKAAYVDLSGMVTGKAKGTTYITASYQGLTAGKVTVDVERVNQCGMQFPKLQQFTGWDVIPPPYPNPDYNNWANYLYANHTASEAAAGGVQNWGNVRVTFGTIGYFGCSLTCYSMVLSSINPSLTPLRLNEIMLANGYYYSGTNYTKPRALVKLGQGQIKKAYNIAYNNDIWLQELNNCNVIIAHAIDGYGSCDPGHYVLIVDYRINDNGDTIFTSYDPSRYAIREITESELCSTNGNVLVKFQ